MVTHLEPDILECEVKWALGSITANKASGGDRIPAELFKILKDAAVTLNMSAHLENSAVATGLEKNQFSFQSQRRAMSKNVQTNTTELISHASKVMFKIHQAGLQQYMNHKFPEVQTGYRKGRGTRDQIAKIRWLIEKARKFQKNIYFCFINYTKAFVYVDHNKLENS